MVGIKVSLKQRETVGDELGNLVLLRMRKEEACRCVCACL